MLAIPVPHGAICNILLPNACQKKVVLLLNVSLFSLARNPCIQPASYLQCNAKPCLHRSRSNGCPVDLLSSSNPTCCCPCLLLGPLVWKKRLLYIYAEEKFSIQLRSKWNCQSVELKSQKEASMNMRRHTSSIFLLVNTSPCRHFIRCCTEMHEYCLLNKVWSANQNLLPSVLFKAAI